MAKKKYDYEGKEFLNRVEEYAKKGYTDKEIAYELDLGVTYFSTLKAENDGISEALSRGRAKINNIVRQRLLAVGLGGLKTKRITTQKGRLANHPEDKVIFEEETELAPNPQVLTTWLFNHDEEWRKKTIEGKKLDVTTNGENVNGPLVFVSASELSEDQLSGLIDQQLGTDGNSGNDTGA